MESPPNICAALVTCNTKEEKAKSCSEKLTPAFSHISSGNGTRSQIQAPCSLGCFLCVPGNPEANVQPQRRQERLRTVDGAAWTAQILDPRGLSRAWKGQRCKRLWECSVRARGKEESLSILDLHVLFWKRIFLKVDTLFFDEEACKVRVNG